MLNFSRRTFFAAPSALALASALLMSSPASAQTISPPQQPLSDIDCPQGVVVFLGQNCVVTGTRTATPTTGTVTPQGGQVLVNGQWSVTYNGNLATDGIPFGTSNGQPFTFDATNFYDPTAVVANVTASYTGQYNNAVLPNTFNTNNPGYFFQYLNQSTTLNSLAVNINQGEFFDNNTGQGFDYSLNSPNPTSIINGNSVAVSGAYQSNNEGSGAIVFGTLSGDVTLNGAGATPANTFPGGQWFSPYRLTYNITPVETTRLDQTGLITPTISVTNGIDLNGSRITELAPGVAGTDAVNLNQLNARTQFLAVNSSAGPASAPGTNAIAIGGDGGDANSDGAFAGSIDAIAIGRDSVASGSETTAVGSGAFAGFSGAVALGKGANATGEISVAIGANVQALASESIGIGAGATPTGARATAIGRGANAVANGTAIGVFANAAASGSTAIGQNAAATRANEVKLGGTGSIIALGDIAASDAAQSGQEFFLTIDNNGTVGRGGQSQAALSQMGSQIASLQQGQALIDDQVAALQTGQAQLFNLSQINRRDIRKANEGVAMALAMESPALPAGTSFALSGGIGYYQNRSAATTAFTARVGKNASVSAGVGFGLNTGEVGARGGFQVAW
jgi:hypothetical protein